MTYRHIFGSSSSNDPWLPWEMNERASADRPRPTPRDEEYGRVVFLRLKVRTATAEQTALGGSEHLIDFEFGPMGAPPEYPRLSINDLLRHAAATA
jgi:hypothetical protein